MIPDDLRPIVDGLMYKATNKEVNWVSAADLGMGAAEDDVVVSFPDFSINIFSSSAEGEEGVVFNILNSKGKLIRGVYLLESHEDFHVLQNLLSLATRQVSGADEILASVERALQRPGVIGSTGPKLARERSDERF